MLLSVFSGVEGAQLDTGAFTYPLGPAAEEKTLPTLGGEDVEFAIVDGSFRHATKTVVSVVPLWGTMHSVIDGRYKLADGGNRHNVIYKGWGPRGWNSTVEYPSNIDVKNATPPGSALEPRAVGFKDKLWVAWEAQNQPFSANPGSAIVLRSRDSTGNWSGVLEVSDPTWTSLNRGVDLLVHGDKLLIAWRTLEGASSAADFSVVGRWFDGATFGSIFSISEAGDGWDEFSLSLATDGTRIAVGFVSQNKSDVVPSYVPRFTVFDGTAWSAEQTLWQENRSEPTYVTPEFYQGRLFLAFDSNDPALSGSGDYDIFLRTADLETYALDPVVAMTARDNDGQDYRPDLAVFNGRLFLAWQSDDDVLTLGSDSDLVITVFDGTSWSTPVDFLRDEKYPNIDNEPRFVEDVDSLHIAWITSVQPPGSTTKDQRFVTRLVERGGRWWDGLTAYYDHPDGAREGANVTARIEVRNNAGSPIRSPWFSARFPNGSWQRLTEVEGAYEVTYVFNASFVEPFEVLAAGKALPMEQADLIKEVLPRTSPGADAVSLVIVLGAVAGAVLRRRK
jgi:hypothetical protein